MIWNFWSPKGGSGCSTVVGAVGLARSRREPVLLVDLDGDLGELLGVRAVDYGLLDWLSAPDPPPDALSRLEVEVSPGLRLLPWSADGRSNGRRPGRPSASIPSPVEGRPELLARMLAADGRLVLVDGGSAVGCLVASAPAALASRSVVVTRGCYLALRRLVDGPTPDEAVLVSEPGRALGADEVAAAAGCPVTAEVRWDPLVARSVDAGLLVSRRPRALKALDRLGTTG